MSPRRYQALVEVDRDEQLDELALLAGNSEIGLAILGPDDGEHLDFVTVVDVQERDDGTYVFAESADAERFADAVDHDRDDDAVVEFRRAFVAETPVNLGAAAERLIASERGDVLEEDFGPGLAADVRGGMALTVALGALGELGEDRSRAARLLLHWIRLDERTGAFGTRRAHEAQVAEDPRPSGPGPAYTVVGCRGRGGAPYVTTVRTDDGPEVALDLAHEAFAKDRSPDVEEVELEIVAIFHGEPGLVDFDAPVPPAAEGGEPR
jgi:hypothetical protein